MRCAAILTLLIGTLLTSGAVAKEGQEELTLAIVAFGENDLEAARKHLETAKSVTADRPTLAKIHRQEGIIDAAEGKRMASVVSFLKAFYFDAQVTLSETEHQGEVARLFACSRTLHARGITERSVQIQYGSVFDAANWKCPSAIDAPPPSPPPPAVGVAPPSATADPPPTSGSSIWSSPVLWIVVGVVAVGGGVAAGVLLTQESGYSGSTGVNLPIER